MPLPWVRLDTSMPDHPKVVELCERGDAGLAAAFVWTCSLAYAGKHGTDGLIVRGILARINGKAKHAQMLVEVRLWDMHPKGWQIHNWDEYNMVALDLDELFPQAARRNGGRSRMSKMTPEERSALGRKAAAARWNGHDPDAY